MWFTYHVDYWRAIAKIGFHYYLLNSRRGVLGHEPDFAGIRRFIMAGGDRDPFFTRPAARFEVPFRELADGAAVLPQSWTHILAADETCSAAVAMVSLFMGPEHLAQTHHINLGRFRSPLVVPGARYAHAYIYNAGQSHNRELFVGRVDAISLTQLR
jgi:hypothetical protein